MDTVTKIKHLDAEFSVSLSDIQTSCMGRGRATQDDVSRRRADRLNFNLFLCPLPIRGNCVGGLVSYPKGKVEEIKC